MQDEDEFKNTDSDSGFDMDDGLDPMDDAESFKFNEDSDEDPDDRYH